MLAEGESLPANSLAAAYVQPTVKSIQDTHPAPDRRICWPILVILEFNAFHKKS